MVLGQLYQGIQEQGVFIATCRILSGVTENMGISMVGGMER